MSSTMYYIVVILCLAIILADVIGRRYFNWKKVQVEQRDLKAALHSASILVELHSKHLEEHGLLQDGEYEECLKRADKWRVLALGHDPRLPLRMQLRR